MKNRPFAFLISTLLLALGTPAFASVTIANGAVGSLRNSSGSIISLGTIGILVADTNNDGLTDPFGTTLSIGNTLGNAGGDFILGVYQAIDLRPSQPGFDLGSTQFTYSGGFSSGDNLYIVWFPTISSTSNAVAANTSYGVYRSNQVDITSSMGWVAPADGDYSLYALDANLGGSPAVSQGSFTATQITAVPEPSAYALLGVAALGSILLRRRYRRA